MTQGHALLPRTWLRRGWLAWLLWPASLVMRLLVAVRRAAYARGWFASGRVPVPVIVVGNVVAGGAGKTPVVLALVQHLQARGLQVGVLSRGYGRTSTACVEVTTQTPLSDSGDEPAFLHHKTGAPLFVAPRRLDAARALLSAYPGTQVLVCDDGLQHLALQRDIEVCVFDDRGVGNGFLLPAGPLREPWPRAVDAVLHSGSQPAFAGFTAHRALAPYAVRADGQRMALADLRGQPVRAVAGIAKPEAFFEMLRQAGLALSSTQAMADHDDFSGWTPPAGASLPLLCTEKDALKLWPRCPEAWAVPLDFSPEPAFLAHIDQLLEPLLDQRRDQPKHPAVSSIHTPPPAP